MMKKRLFGALMALVLMVGVAFAIGVKLGDIGNYYATGDLGEFTTENNKLYAPDITTEEIIRYNNGGCYFYEYYENGAFYRLVFEDDPAIWTLEWSWTGAPPWTFSTNGEKVGGGDSWGDGQ